MLAAWLRKEAGGVESPDCAALLERVDFHGIAGLIYAQPALHSGWPDALCQALRDRAINRLLWEKNHARILGQILPLLGDTPLLLKGTALAYSCYTDPAMRVRGDTDILVADGAYDSAARALREQGLITHIESRGRVISIEETFTFSDRAGFEHHIDLHRKLSNSAVLAGLFSYREFQERSVALPGLGPAARALGKVDALLVACMHRKVHLQSPYYVNGVAYHSADRLIWLYDIHLLAGGFSDQDWRSLLTQARNKGLMEIVADGLGSAKQALNTAIAEGILPELARPHQPESPARYLGAPRRQQIVLNFAATPGVGPKARFLRELAFPDANHMRTQFAHVRPAWLPWLYSVRAASGIWKLLRPGSGRK